jgi:hypothetical protein
MRLHAVGKAQIGHGSFYGAARGNVPAKHQSA